MTTINPNDPEMKRVLQRLKALNKAGNQQEIDEIIGFCHCPQEVEPRLVGENWTQAEYNAEYDWRMRGWLRDHCKGKFSHLSALFSNKNGIIAFEDENDAFAFRVRWWIGD